MGEIADAMLSGLFCAECGGVFDDHDEPGYPRYCCIDNPREECRPPTTATASRPGIPARKPKTQAQRDRRKRARKRYRANRKAKQHNQSRETTMDPTANLEEQLRIAQHIMEIDEAEQIDPTEAYRLAELVEALHNWILGGGFLPKEWNDARRTR